MTHFDHWTCEHPIRAYVAVTAAGLVVAACLTGALQAFGLS